MDEDSLTVGQIIKVKWPTTIEGEENDHYQKVIIIDKKEAKKEKESSKYKFKLQLKDHPEEIIKVRLNEIEWKLSKKRHHHEEAEEKAPAGEKKKKKHSAKTIEEVTEFPVTPLQSYNFKRFIPPAVLKYIVAPMVGASELPFRLLCRRYGATLAYTPMINSERFAFDENYRKEEFQTTPEDRPLVAHFCANNPEFYLKAVKHVEDQCDAIDLNLGCPQRVAFSGHFGSFLLDEADRPLVLNMVRTIADNAKVPIFVKIRLLDTIEDTLKLCQQLVEAGAALITIHGRYRVNLVGRTGPGARDGPAHLDQIKYIRSQIPSHIPIIANGNIITWQDIQNNLQLTECNGVMSAEGLLDNPAIFNGGIPVPAIRLAKEYLSLVKLYPVKLKTLIFHIRRMCKDDLMKFQLMEDCLVIPSLEEMNQLIDKLENYVEHPNEFLFNQQKEMAMKKRLELKKNEESKRKLFEERMIRKAKREGLKDLFFYLNQGSEVPSNELIQQLKLMKKEDAFEIWKNKHSQHCWNFHFGLTGCERDRKCPFLHQDPKFMDDNNAAYG